MTKKKRNHPDIEEVLSRPWCYYCERDFDDLKILINHQKAKHFKCERCGRRLSTAGGLSVHMSQVHKENLTAVDNALPNRAGLEIEIFGMEGIPEEVIQQHNQRMLTQFHQAQAEHQAASGSGVAGAGGPNAMKKPKTEDMSDLKKRLAEHKAAKMAAEQGSPAGSGSATPTGAGAGPTPIQQPFAAPPAYPPFQQPYAPPPTNGSYNASPTPTQNPQSYFQQPTSYTQNGISPQPGYGNGPPQHSPNMYGQPSTIQTPYNQTPYSHPQPGFVQTPHTPYSAQPAFSPSAQHNQFPFPGQQYPQHSPVQFPGQNGLPNRPYGPPNSVSPFQHAHPNAPRAHSPGQNGNNFPQPVRTGSVSLPTNPGLPQRPAFAAPPVNAFQFQQMHQGQIPVSQNHALPQYQKQDSPASAYMNPQNGIQSAAIPPSRPAETLNGASPVTQATPGETIAIPPPTAFLNGSAAPKVDSALTPVANLAPTSATSAPATAPIPTSVIASTTTANSGGKEETDDKTTRKEKEKAKASRLVYSDNDTSPEEKMAMMARYAFIPSQKTIMV